MKLIRSLRGLNAFLAEPPDLHYKDLRFQRPIRTEVIEQRILAGRSIPVPETDEEGEEMAAGCLQKCARHIAGQSGWRAVARFLLQQSGRPELSGVRRRSLAAHLRRQYGR